MTETRKITERTDRLSVDAQDGGALAALGGVRPQGPGWFDAALARAPERTRIDVDGAGIEVLAWGERGLPGLLLLHGNGAHADWWSPLAPFFVDSGYRVAAMSWSGMGGSDWRAKYHPGTFAREALAACEAAGLFEAPVKPVLVAHSFGGFLGLYCAARYGERLGAVISVDSPIEPPGHTHDRPPSRSRPNRVYPRFEDALARFRLAPQQGCGNLWYLDHVARGSIKAAEGGFTWKFDPFIWHEFELGDPSPLLQRASCPVAVIWGDRSSLMPPEVVAYMRSLAPAGSPFLAIPDADHHVMIDQPLPFVAAVRGLLAGWPRGAQVATGGGAV